MRQGSHSSQNTCDAAWLTRRFVSAFTVCLLVCICSLPVVRSAHADDSAEQAVVIPFAPIPKLIPSWQLNFRPRQRAGIQLGEYFFMDIPQVGAGLKYEFQDETRTNNDVETTELYHKFSEKVGFRTNGWVYNPALCSFTATLEPELSQVYEEDGVGNSASGNLFTPDYLLSANFLKEKPYTLNLHANRREMPSWAPFKGGFESRIHDLGGKVQVDINQMFDLSTNYYTNFGYNRFDSVISGFYEQEDVNDSLFWNLQQQGKNFKTDFDTNYSDELRTTDGIDTRTKTLNSKLVNNYIFREGNRIVLDSYWTYRNQDLETVDQQTFRITEQLNWQHRKKLNSFYRFMYNYQDSNGENGSHIAGLEGRLQHTLFDNLTSSVGAETTYSSYADGQEFTLDPYLQFRYSRPTPIGALSLGARWNYQMTSRDYDSAVAEINVQDEVLQMSYAQNSFLDNYNIDTASIIVTNSEGTTRYIEGIDYQIEVIGDYVAIRSLSLGDIDNGQDVQVSYRYSQDSAYDDGIFTQHYNLAYTFFNTTRVQLTHSRAKQDILDGIAPRVMVDDTVSRASIQHSVDWSTSRLEMDVVDRALSNLIYTSWQASQRFSIRPLRTVNCTLAGYYGETNYDSESAQDSARDDVLSWGGTVGASWEIARGLAFNLEGFTNRQESDIEETINTGVRTGLTYTYRIWSARLSYQFTNQSLTNEGRETSRQRNFVRFDIVRLYW